MESKSFPCRAPRRLSPRWRLPECRSANSCSWDFCRRARRLAAKLFAIWQPRTVAIYEAPHRLLDTLEDALEILGNRPAVIAREITKVYEDFQRGHIEDLLAAAQKKAPRGEITLLIGPPDGHATHAETDAPTASLVPLARRVDEIMSDRGVDRKAALKQAARERGITRREAYKQLLITRDES
jgi:16S rRNA (cytidine1402-2'-O)-methyltransferase